ncbi:hypothetical protein MY494_05300 [Synechococcus sp. A10-1-5-1]|uniref:type IV pilus modification PilV family protein n=1 Tax=Synechococcus sp. A10-1-5-1 TaxID=2936507 RepID=UPI002000D4EE|nr:hypothetical protein [Synechococcus sp. A10-1-5-1]UPM51176.1 hypothetical protein MY494_05300 [Synechococcus sp. A10-1-5-1]
MKQPRHLKSKDQDRGFILPLVMIISLIIATGLMALAARSWLGLSGTIRQSQSRQAREIAEAGIARTLESLNRSYSYLLIKSYDSSVSGQPWNDGDYISSVCPDVIFGEPSLSGTVGANGKYTLLSYLFQGSPFYGGKATIRMKGERLHSNNAVAATSIVEETIDIRPKSCTNSFGEPTVTSGFPGLLGQKVVLGNNDVFGTLSGNVLCLQCYSGTDFESLTREQQEAYIQMNKNGSVAGQIFLGPIDLPSVPEPPAGLTFDTPASITSSTTLTAGQNTGPCRIEDKGDEPPITHCVVDDISLKSKNEILTVDTTAGDVRIYVRGSEAVFTGGAAIKHIPDSASASSLGLFGNPIDPDNTTTDQLVRLAGASTANALWAYFPDGNMGINGGSKETADCDAEGECTGGDINGAIWAKEWNGSSSNVAQLVVPADIGTQLFNKFGPQFALGIRDYVALGVSHWSSWTKQ